MITGLLVAVWFLVCTGFYVVRVVFPEMVKKREGHFDIENELAHGLCMVGMVTMLSPGLLPIPGLAWTGVFGFSTLWFLARALTWGKRVKYTTKWWYDWTHVIMLAGMAYMYSGHGSLWVNIPLLAFWVWLLAYYTKELVIDVRARMPLDIGADLAHGTMGLVMLLMTIFPSAFMGHDMSSMAAVDAPADEESLRKLIYDPQATNVIFVWGGCRQCAEGASNFDRLATEICGAQLRFVRLDKNKAPGLCKELGISRCPVVLLFDRGVLASRRLDSDINDRSILALITERR